MADADALPECVESVEELEELLSRPTPGVIETLSPLDGDILVLGAGGKMGPTLARMAARAVASAGLHKRVIAVSTFSSMNARRNLEDAGVETLAVDLLAPGAMDTLPDAANVIYMLGRKFGSSGAEWDTWAVNAFAPGLVGRRYQQARIVAFSSGNVYPFAPVDSGGCKEDTPPAPVGEYAMSCLGRERLFEYCSRHYGTRVLQYRLNYAVELRYGVLLDIAQRLLAGAPLDVTMGYVNVVWQRYANAVALQSLTLASAPPRVLNVTGREILSVRSIGERLGKLLEVEPRFTGTEAPTALLSDASECHRLFGAPDADADTLMRWVAHWVKSGGAALDKPTHFQTRNGKF